MGDSASRQVFGLRILPHPRLPRVSPSGIRVDTVILTAARQSRNYTGFPDITLPRRCAIDSAHTLAASADGSVDPNTTAAPSVLVWTSGAAE
ncbi:hypothetical protein KEM60_01043 [Austwickia sp. TVS 96-490-7B]|nr:hypothetical protein [Austwickia sp. TVS 96-490-7B]